MEYDLKSTPKCKMPIYFMFGKSNQQFEPFSSVFPLAVNLQYFSASSFFALINLNWSFSSCSFLHIPYLEYKYRELNWLNNVFRNLAR